MKDNKLETLVKACSVCHNIYRPKRNEWINVGEPIYEEIKANYPMTHGYCYKCLPLELEKVRKLKNNRCYK